MKINLRHLVALGAAALAIQLNANAQNFTNNTNGTYGGSCNAVIKMKADNGAFNGTATLGTADLNRIAGTVEWASIGTGPQTVQGLYYTNLLLSGVSTKTVATGVHVGGVNSCAQSYSATGGARTYEGTFFYDGNQPQTIFAEGSTTGSTNRYNNLDLSGGGTKTVSGSTNAMGSLADASGTNMILTAGLTYGTGASSIAGTVDINTGGSLTASADGTTSLAASGVINVNDGSLNLNSTGTFTNLGTIAVDATGTYNQGANSNLLTSGTFTNAGTGTNMNYDCTATTEFAGTSVLASVATNRFGLIRFSGASNKTAAGSIFVCGNVTFENGSGNLVMGATTASTNVLDIDVTGDTPANVIAFDDDNQYIQGKVKMSGTLVNTGAYTFNTKQTQMTFASVPTDIQLDVIPGVAPSKLNDFNSTRDVSRTVELSFTGTGSISNLRVGYNATSDLIGGFTGTEANMRFAEAHTVGSASQKLIGGSGIATNSGAANPRFVNLASATGINLVAGTGGGTTKELTSGSQLLLTTAPNTFIALNPGRWTNTAVWDEGSLPTATDNAEIRTYVYAGIASTAASQAFNTATTGNDITEFSHYGNNPVANSITIASGFTNAALILGNEDNPDNFVFFTALSGISGGVNAGFYNNNATAQGSNWTNLTYSKATDPATANNGISGLFITNIKGATKSTIFGTAQITNAGPIYNHDGTIEVSQ